MLSGGQDIMIQEVEVVEIVLALFRIMIDAGEINKTWRRIVGIGTMERL